MKIFLIGLAFLSSAGFSSEMPDRKPAYETELWRAIRIDLPEKIRFELHNLNVPAAVPASAHISRLTPHPPMGAVQFSLDWQAGGREQHAFGGVTVRAYGKIAIARIALTSADRLDGDGVVFEERELSPYSNSGYFLDADPLAELHTKGFLRAGSVLNSGNTQTPYLVVSGQTLAIVHNQGLVQVTAQVKAMANGRQGDWIRVENPVSKKIITAKVTGAGEVQTR
jgi:flagella basal body P-ring formation protein FlgA